MPILRIDCDEQWPTYSLQKPSYPSKFEVDIPEDLYTEYLFIMLRYYQIQKKLESYHLFVKTSCENQPPINTKKKKKK